MTTMTLEAPEAEALDDNAGIHPFLVELMGRIDMEPTFKSERGLLYSFRSKVALDPHPDNLAEALKTIEYEVLIKPETVTFRNITQTVGINRHSDKVYKNWKTDRTINLSLKAEKHGHRVLRVYETLAKTKKYNGSFTNATARFAEHFTSDLEAGVSDYFEVDSLKPEYSFSSSPTLQYKASSLASWALYQLLKELDPANPAFNSRSFSVAASYPVLQLFPNSVFNLTAIRASLPKNYSLHSELDVKKFITKTFGAEGVRKDMVKAVVNTTDINSIFLAARLKHLFPLDWLRDFMKSPNDHVIYDNSITYTEESVQGLVSLFGLLTVPQRKRLLVEKVPGGKRDYVRDSSFLIRDAIRMFSDLNPEAKEEYGARIDYSSWHSLHQTLVHISNEIRAKEAATIGSSRFDLTGTYMEKLNETSYEVEGEVYKLIAPRNGHDLSKWGNEMHNCIGSYQRDVVKNRTNVFAVHNKDGLFANVEIATNGRIAQHMQKYNSRSSEEHWVALSQHIETVDEAIKKKEAAAKKIEKAQLMRRNRHALTA